MDWQIVPFPQQVARRIPLNWTIKVTFGLNTARRLAVSVEENFLSQHTHTYTDTLKRD